MRPDNQLVIGLDIGGTKIYAGVIDRQGKIYATAKMKTRAHTGFPATFERIKRCIRQVVQTAGLKISAIQALGVGAPGPLNPTTGVVIDTPNLGWKNVPLQTTLQQEFGIPVKIDNDVNVGVWGEHIFGAGQGIAHLIGLFIGTGLGGGVIIDGKLLHGFNQNAGELGHVIINPNGPRCNCGVRGHLEAYVSKTGIDQYLRQAISKGKTT